MKKLYTIVLLALSFNALSQITDRDFTSPEDTVRSGKSNEFYNFNVALPEDGELQCEWSILTDADLEEFNVEYSSNAIDFENCTIIKGSTDYSSTRNFHVTLKAPPEGTWYFRLKHTSDDGQVSYSQIISKVLSTATSVVTVYPNPSPAGFINLEILTKDLSGNPIINIIGRSGRTIFSSHIRSETFQHSLELEKGYYFLVITESNGNLITKKIIVN
ncbi:MAG TPA: T9SS type A sorting domain-containing protein [Bacteroidia bacterium]|jgi:hypothetical protein